MAWFDFNADGWDDLLIPAGRGGRAAAFRNDGKGSFVPQRSKLLEARVTRDVTTFLGWRPNSSNIILLSGLSSYEETTTNSPLLRETSIVTGQDSLQVFPTTGSVGPMSLADFDGDGDLDLFIGGRVIPGRYPEPASSIILRNNKGNLELDEQMSEPFSRVGLVSGASAVDLDTDGWPDLVLACEWGPIRIFRNNSGHFVSWDVPVRG